MDNDRNVDFDIQGPADLDGVPPITPSAPPPREPSRGPFVPFKVFAPIFLAVALIVGLERISMIFVVAESYPVALRLGDVGLFFAIVLGIWAVGGVLFARNYGK